VDKGGALRKDQPPVKPVFWILFCVLLAGLARSHNLRDVFVENGIYFIDADCYSRMTRASLVQAQPGLVLREHHFENAPHGIQPHTTAPLDYLIVGLAAVVRSGFRIFDSASTSVLASQTLDLAGALIAPILGMLSCGFIGAWARSATRSWPPEAPRRAWMFAPLFFSISPILVHGTLLGRPDHQALLVMLMAVALAAELQLAEGPSQGWALASGIAWALGLWTSLYEPLVLLLVVLGLWLTFARKRFWNRERRAGVLVFALLLAVSFVIEGWRFAWPDAALREAFARWQQSIGELSHLNLLSPVLWRWLGFGAAAAPVLLYLGRRTDSRALPLLAGFLVLLGLTVWQVRWGYFLALVFALALPWQMLALRRLRIAWPLFIVALWPVLRDWDERLFPEPDAQRQMALQRRENTLLREVALRMKATAEPGTFLAPWWLSPSLAYWSGRPGVAGSSHQSLPGILDSARLYLTTGEAESAEILRLREVRWVIADEPSRVVQTSAALLGIAPPDRALASRLYAQPEQAAPGLLRPMFENQFYKLFTAETVKVQHE
jgi:hypothetical protein